MHRGSRKAGSLAVAQRRSAGPLSSSTDTSGSSSREAQPVISTASVAAAATRGGVQLRAVNFKDFKEQVDSTIQQLSGLVSLLYSRETGMDRRQQPSNSSNRGDADDRAAVGPPCCCRCQVADGGSFQLSPTLSSRRHTRSSRDFSAPVARTPTSSSRRQAPCGGGGGGESGGAACFTGDTSDANDTGAAAGRRKSKSITVSSTTIGGGGGGGSAEGKSGGKQRSTSGSLAEPPSQAAAIRFLWYDSGRRRYATKAAELICAKSVKRLHLCVHYFRVGGEDLLLLEKDCSDDGLAFLDVDSVVAFEGLSVEKVLKLQKLGCQLRPEELSREFAVEKGRSKYYVVPVEEEAGDWRLCDGAGAKKLESLKRILEQQEVRRGATPKKSEA